MPKTFIIIVTYNGMTWIEKCLESIPFQSCKVIVVDNASNDNTVQFVKNNFKDVKIIESDKNLGFGKANNLGISHAYNQGATHFFLLNQDAYIIGDCLEHLVDFQKKNPEYGILSPIHLNDSQTLLDHGFANYVAFSRNPYFYSDHVIENKIKPVYEVPFVNAASWLLSRKCVETLGGFDPIFFHYGEDDNYCQRARYHNVKIGVVPNVKIIHDRELRQKQIFNVFSKQYFLKREKGFNVTLGDINNDCDFKYKTLIKGLRFKSFKALLKLNLKEFSGYLNELKLLKKRYPSILRSRKLNKEIGIKYLSGLN